MAAVAAVALPIATLSVRVDLPPVASGGASAPACPALAVKFDRTGGVTRMTLNGAPTTRQNLLLDMFKARKCSPGSTTVLMRAGKDVTYSDFMAVMNELQKGGYAHNLLLTEGRSAP